MWFNDRNGREMIKLPSSWACEECKSDARTSVKKEGMKVDMSSDAVPQDEWYLLLLHENRDGCRERKKGRKCGCILVSSVK